MAPQPQNSGEGYAAAVEATPETPATETRDVAHGPKCCARLEKPKPFWKSMEFWLASGTWVLAAITFWATRDSESSIETSERAWVAPVEARLDEPLEKDRPIKVVVLLENSGKQPALNVQNVASGGITLPFSNEEAAQQQKNRPSPPAEEQCTGYPKQNGVSFYDGIVIYPSTVRHLQASIQDSFVADQSVLSGGRTFFVHGCATYDTIGGHHSSEYCFWLGPRVDPVTGNRKFQPCLGGNKAT
jgi:hypothetical protein